MEMTTMQHIENCFNSGSEFVGVKLTIPNAPGYEVIINPRENYKEKLAYYKNTYDENGVHKHVSAIKIVDCSNGETFEGVRKGLDI